MNPEPGPLEQLLTKIEQRESLAPRVGRILQEPTPAAARWYDKPVLVGFIGTVIAAVLPATTAIDGCISKSTDLELARRKLEHEISTGYISSYALKDALIQALNPELSQTHRLRALRFLAAVAPDRVLREWARTEYERAAEYMDIAHARRLLGVQEAPAQQAAPVEAEAVASARSPEGALQGQWPQNEIVNVEAGDKDRTTRLLEEHVRDMRDPRAAVAKIKTEIGRINSDPDIPADTKTERRKELEQRLIWLEESSSFANAGGQSGSDKETKG